MDKQRDGGLFEEINNGNMRGIKREERMVSVKPDKRVIMFRWNIKILVGDEKMTCSFDYKEM